MTTEYAPPFVVSGRWIDETGMPMELTLDLWTRMANDVYVLEKRIDPETWRQIALFPMEGGDIIAQSMYDPVFEGPKIGDDIQTYVALPPKAEADPKELDVMKPVAYWLKIGLVPASERMRYPQLPAKCNMKEGKDMLSLRELFDWDGTGFKLRDEAWGRL